MLRRVAVGLLFANVRGQHEEADLDVSDGTGGDKRDGGTG